MVRNNVNILLDLGSILIPLAQMDSTETRKENEQKALKYMKQAVLAKTILFDYQNYLSIGEKNMSKDDVP